MDMQDPSQQGPYSYTAIIYNSDGVQFDTGYVGHAAFTVYNAPSEHYTVRRRLDLSAFCPTIPDYSDPPRRWPFAIDSVPLYGHIRVPDGKGKFPLALFVHGQYTYEVDSASGYLYLCDLLASHGIISASIAQECLQERYVTESRHERQDVPLSHGEIDGRPVLWPLNGIRVISALEHIKQFRIWNVTVGHPLHGRVDMDHILICGQSSGGLSVVNMSYGNTLEEAPLEGGNAPVKLDGSLGLGPYDFKLRAIVAMAPSYGADIQAYSEQSVKDDFFLLIGALDSQDGGYNNYRKANILDPDQPAISNGKSKGTWRVYGGNHNFFNEAWTINNKSDGAPDAGPGYLKPEQQRQVAKVYISSIALSLLREDRRYLAVLKDHSHANDWIQKGTDPETPVRLISDYQDGKRLYVQHHQEAGTEPVISEPLKGSVHSENLLVGRRPLGAGAGEYADLHALRLEWNSRETGVYELIFTPALLLTKEFAAISMTFFQMDGDSVGSDPLDFTIVITDDAGNTTVIKASEYHGILYPEFNSNGTCYRLARQAVRIPFERLGSTGGAQAITSLRLVFPAGNAGVIYNGDIQISA